MIEMNNNYDEAVSAIKAAILQSQYEAARSVNEKQLMLYYGIGKYILLNSRKGFWERVQSTRSVICSKRNCRDSGVFQHGIYVI